MIPPGVEVRPELQARGDVLAFGFAGERVTDQAAVRLLGGDLLNYVLAATEKAPAGLVVVDMRNVEPLSTTGLGRLSALRQKLSQVPWKLLLLIGDPITRDVLDSTRLDRLFIPLAGEAELRDFVNRYTPVSSPSPPDGPPEFTASELTGLEAAGITLDDAIRAVEGLRR